MTNYNMHARSSIVKRENEFSFQFDDISLPIPKPSDWRDDMTICIAAICEEGRSIVSISDRMISLSGATSADSVTTKGIRVHENWAAMFAANDVTLVDPILRAVTDSLRTVSGTMDEVVGAFRTSYQTQFRRQAEDKILSVFGIDMKTFVQRGVKDFGKDVFYDLYSKIQREERDFDVSFLVHGFEPNLCARLFTIDAPGVTKEYRRTGFWAIGSGQNNALSSLFFQKYNIEMNLNKAFYLCCEAKFMSETASGVGRDTVAAFLNSDRTCGLLHNEDIEPIRKQWEQDGQPRIPKAAERTIADMIQGVRGSIVPFTP